jgi:hypothetical protein
MNGDQVRQRLKKQPFEPFEVRMSSGDVSQIQHPENVLVTGANHFKWYPDDPGDHVVHCSLLHVSGLEYIERRAKKKGPKS